MIQLVSKIAKAKETLIKKSLEIHDALARIRTVHGFGENSSKDARVHFRGKQLRKLNWKF